PAQPVLQLRGNRGIELETVIAGMREVRIKTQAFRQSCLLGKLGIKFLAEYRFGAVLHRGRNRSNSRGRSGIRQGVRAEGVAVVGETAEHVKRGARRFDGVVTEAAAKNISQIQMLQRVGFEIGSSKSEKCGPEIVIAANPGGQGIR